MPTKFCNKCDTSKELYEFNKDATKKDGLHSVCKSCNNKKSKEFRTNHPILAKQSKLNCRAKDPVKYILINIKSRCKLNNTEFNITKDDLVYIDTCPVLGIKLDYLTTAESRGLPKDNAASIDRIDNSKGYIPGNVRIVSWRANKIKNDIKISEMQAIIKDYEAILNR